MADADDVRRIASALSGVVEIDSEGFDFRVAGKGFVWSYPERRPGQRRLIRTDATVLAAARQVGGGRAVLDRTVEHVRTREQFDRPIGTFQAVQHQLADAATELDAASLAVAQAAWAVDGQAPAAADRLAAVAALAAGAAFRRTTLVAHQLHGGMGFVLDSPLHLWSARAVADPTTPLTRRHLLDRLAAANGVTAGSVTVPPDHRVTTTARR